LLTAIVINIIIPTACPPHRDPRKDLHQGRWRLHLVQLPKRLGHIRCGYDAPGSISRDLDRNCMPHRERKNYFTEEWPVGEEQAKSSDGGLALLRTCRQIHRECSELLYANNVFDVNHPQTLAFLERTIRPNRLATIKYLQLTWKRAQNPIDPKPAELEVKEPDSSMTPDGIHTWWWACKMITERMAGLRTLKVKITANYWHATRNFTNYSHATQLYTIYSHATRLLALTLHATLLLALTPHATLLLALILRT
jgi:hypothetical protein